jgi:hypothetical protein
LQSEPPRNGGGCDFEFFNRIGQLQTLESHSPLQTFMQRCHPIECARRGTSRLDDSLPVTGGVSKQRAPAVLRSLVLNEKVGTGVPTPATLRGHRSVKPDDLAHLSRLALWEGDQAQALAQARARRAIIQC